MVACGIGVVNNERANITSDDQMCRRRNAEGISISRSSEGWSTCLPTESEAVGIRARVVVVLLGVDGAVSVNDLLAFAEIPRDGGLDPFPLLLSQSSQVHSKRSIDMDFDLPGYTEPGRLHGHRLVLPRFRVPLLFGGIQRKVGEHLRAKVSEGFQDVVCSVVILHLIERMSFGVVILQFIEGLSVGHCDLGGRCRRMSVSKGEVLCAVDRCR
jgi:hypothetical protein